MFEETGLITTYRNRVLSISAGLMVYAIAGGSVSTVDKNSTTESAAEITLFGVKLLFSRPGWLIWAALMLVVYFWWRHYQLTTKNKGRFYDEVYRNIVISSSIVDKITKYGNAGCDDIVQSEYNYGIEVIRGDITRDDMECGQDNIVFIKKIGLAKYELTMFELSSHSFDYHVRHGQLNYFNGQADTVSFETERLIDRVQVFLLHCRAFVSLSLNSPSFTDAILPDILTFMSVFVVIVNSVMSH
ncbi:hypothetical protein [Aeromonas hydrophila]|uniref:hypothetical protein n=1 Tax=Aeromonas hydrophila TaxID=644 RepID=UPI0019315ADD|nr:hypothetical protein [Aeromonas hydrophila]MBM0511424.1 hypothetical protein [Aeromonas hydrophila]MBW3771010.1 hypothetical protein [Aeromonas hydrophila]